MEAVVHPSALEIHEAMMVGSTCMTDLTAVWMAGKVSASIAGELAEAGAKKRLVKPNPPKRERLLSMANKGGVSSLFFAFADLVIHSIFNTNHRNWTINDASAYLDLSILYGNSEKDVERVRSK